MNEVVAGGTGEAALEALLERAQAHQRFAETQLQELRIHTHELDGVVREELRRALVEELSALIAEVESAQRALRELKHAAGARARVALPLMALVPVAIAWAVSFWILPSPSAVAALRMQRDALAREIGGLERRGGRAEWRSCGSAARLCVRIDRKAPTYGVNGDFYVVGGY